MKVKFKVKGSSDKIYTVRLFDAKSYAKVSTQMEKEISYFKDECISLDGATTKLHKEDERWFILIGGTEVQMNFIKSYEFVIITYRFN